MYGKAIFHSQVQHYPSHPPTKISATRISESEGIHPANAKLEAINKEVVEAAKKVLDYCLTVQTRTQTDYLSNGKISLKFTLGG